MAKKIHKNQITGKRGEVQFEDFALRNGLVPQPTRSDHGIDYICQLTERLNEDCLEVLASCLLVNIKTSTLSDPNPVIDRDEVETLFKSTSEPVEVD